MGISSKMANIMNISRQIEMLTNSSFLSSTEGLYDSVVTFNTIYGGNHTTGIGSSQEPGKP